MRKKLFISAGVLVIAIAAFLLAFPSKTVQAPQKGNVKVSMPAENNQPETQTSQNDAGDTITVDVPKADNVVTSPLEISGKARGSWFFEAVFPVRVVDDNGKELGKGQAMAQGEWMTTDFVKFKGVITFSAGGAVNGKVIFANDNPSGLPENARSFEITVKFAK